MNSQQMFQVEDAVPMSGDVLADHLRSSGVRCCFRRGVLFARQKLPHAIPRQFVPRSVLDHLERLEDPGLSDSQKRTSRKLCRRYGLIPIGRPVGPMAGLSKADESVRRAAHRQYMKGWQRQRRQRKRAPLDGV